MFFVNELYGKSTMLKPTIWDSRIPYVFSEHFLYWHFFRTSKASIAGPGKRNGVVLLKRHIQPVSPRWSRSIDTTTSHCRLLVPLRSGVFRWRLGQPFFFKYRWQPNILPQNIWNVAFWGWFFWSLYYYLAFGFGLGFLFDVFWKETSWFIKCSTSNSEKSGNNL